jgi:hypothetical protein
MNLDISRRPKLSLQFGRSNPPAGDQPVQNNGSLSAHELQRIVSQMVG